MERSEAYPKTESGQFGMKNLCKLCCVFLLSLYAATPICAELLGKISDETATVPDLTPLSPAQNKRRIIYRVICPAGGEVLPECEQPPVEDVLDTVVVPAVAEPESKPEQIAGGAEKSFAKIDQDLPKKPAHKSGKDKKTVADKKHAKKIVKKTAKAAAKPSKQKRH
jgi:hypothetical protein